MKWFSSLKLKKHDPRYELAFGFFTYIWVLVVSEYEALIGNHERYNLLQDPSCFPSVSGTSLAFIHLVGNGSKLAFTDVPIKQND